jgi:hypothetical protein
MLNVIMLSVIMLSVIMLSVVMLSVIMLNVIHLSVFMLSVVAPSFHNVLFSLQLTNGPITRVLFLSKPFQPSLMLASQSLPE